MLPCIGASANFGVTLIALIALASLGFLTNSPRSSVLVPKTHPLQHAFHPSGTITQAQRETAPYIFSAVQGLLRQWPNTYAPNGHSIVAGTVPMNTLLYHAKHGPRPPDNLQFFAFDAEMSIGIYGATEESVLHTLVTTRPLRVIYFDGQSATLTETGTLDAQMAVLYRQIPVDPDYDHIYDDDTRGTDLCGLVRRLGIDGVVRMNAGFELLLCDWPKSGVEHLYSTNLTMPGNIDRSHNDSLPNDPNRQPPLGFGNAFAEQNSYEWLRSASWQYGGYGQGGSQMQRIHIDACKMVSFYDPSLESLAGLHHPRTVGNQSFQNGWGLRRGHRLVGISAADVGRVVSQLEQITQSETHCTGVDWIALFASIVDQFAGRSRELALILDSPVDTVHSATEVIRRVHELSHSTIYSYLQYPLVASDTVESLKRLALRRCSTSRTRILGPIVNYAESLLYRTTIIILERLCSDQWDLFEWSESYTTGLLGHTQAIRDIRDVQEEISEYSQRIHSLIDWMGWADWTDCERQCQPDELCSIPTWPVVYAPGFPQGGIYAGNNTRTTEDDMAEFWRPKCINRADFDRGGGRGREPQYQFPDVPGNSR